MARKPLISAAMLDLMARREHHAWTLEDLQAGLAEHGAAAEFLDVFRAAEKLAGDGIVLKLALEDGRARFELDERAPRPPALHVLRRGGAGPVRDRGRAILRARSGDRGRDQRRTDHLQRPVPFLHGARGARLMPGIDLWNPATSISGSTC